jgi:hypothetical protein
MQKQIDDLKKQLSEFTKIVDECRTINVSRRGSAGGRGEIGATGAPGKDAVCLCREVVGIQGERGPEGNVDRAVEEARQMVSEEMFSFQGRLHDVVKSELVIAGAIDQSGKAVPGTPGRDGRDAVCVCTPGPKGEQGLPADVNAVAELASDIVLKQAYEMLGAEILGINDRLRDLVKNQIRLSGFTDENGNAVIHHGRDGVDGQSIKGDTGATGVEGLRGPTGKPGDISMAVANAEREARSIVQAELAKFRQEILAELSAQAAATKN